MRLILNVIPLSVHAIGFPKQLLASVENVITLEMPSSCNVGPYGLSSHGFVLGGIKMSHSGIVMMPPIALVQSILIVTMILIFMSTTTSTFWNGGTTGTPCLTAGKINDLINGSSMDGFLYLAYMHACIVLHFTKRILSENI